MKLPPITLTSKSDRTRRNCVQPTGVTNASTKGVQNTHDKSGKLGNTSPVLVQCKREFQAANRVGAEMVVFTKGKAPTQSRTVSTGPASKRSVSINVQSKPKTLDARFSMLQDLSRQAHKRQGDSRNALLAKKRGINVEQRPAQACPSAASCCTAFEKVLG